MTAKSYGWPDDEPVGNSKVVREAVRKVPVSGRCVNKYSEARVEWGAMWLGPALFIGVSVFLWRYIGAVFVPELMARALFRFIPALRDMELVILINAAIAYFAGYFLFAFFWRR